MRRGSALRPRWLVAVGFLTELVARRERTRRFLELEVWSRVPEEQRGRGPDKAEREQILGFGNRGV